MAIEQFIDNEVKGNDVVLFMKGTPQFPMCGFSAQVDHILRALGIETFNSEDYKEGTRAFLEKRPPRFLGR